MERHISWEDVQELKRKNIPYLLVDVREAEEVVMGALEAARHIPLEQLAYYAPMVLPDKHTLIICYCMTGRRSSAAVRTLQQLGYTNVANLPEGYLGTVVA